MYSAELKLFSREFPISPPQTPKVYASGTTRIFEKLRRSIAKKGPGARHLTGSLDTNATTIQASGLFSLVESVFPSNRLKDTPGE